ncbi:C-type mannose receptor 2 [Amia ocellicauda]|uniref:C-type mannose receptor 2 n=1 Tax=Amia ocellicauda TaxID=2972642 RepID=UPI003464B81D
MEGKGWLVLLLTVLCPLGSCHFRQFYFINKTLNWTEAQMYCRDNYTDLASIDNAQELDQLLNVTHSPGTETAWIGLRRDCRENWQWSDGEELRFTHWKSHLPCAALNTEGSWENRSCQETNYFICETQEKQKTSKTYILVMQDQSFNAAQRHCREMCTELLRIEADQEYKDVKQAAQNHTVWIALFQDGWHWSDGNHSWYRNWQSGEPNNAGSSNCVEIYLQDTAGPERHRGRWNDAGCNGIKPFFCCNATVEEWSPEKYRFIQFHLSWEAARNYCRANHSDLVTVYNKEQQDRLLSLTNNTKETGAWIGLGPKSESASKGQTVGYSNWTQGHLCVTLDSEGQWEERYCGESNYFLCNTSDCLNITLIREYKTWPQAQKHCRENHTELLSVRSQSENDEIANMIASETVQGVKVWLGLYNKPWKWSAQGTAHFRNWAEGKPGGEECVGVMVNGTLRGQWTDANCTEERPFICHYDTRELILVNESKTWFDALTHCQSNQSELAEIRSFKEQRYAVEVASSSQDSQVWLGLRQSRIWGFWFWVSGETLTYGNWSGGEAPQDVQDKHCAALDTETGSWSDRDCEDKLRFICERE